MQNDLLYLTIIWEKTQASSFRCCFSLLRGYLGVQKHYRVTWTIFTIQVCYLGHRVSGPSPTVSMSMWLSSHRLFPARYQFLWRRASLGQWLAGWLCPELFTESAGSIYLCFKIIHTCQYFLYLHWNPLHCVPSQVSLGEYANVSEVFPRQISQNNFAEYLYLGLQGGLQGLKKQCCGDRFWSHFII